RDTVAAVDTLTIVKDGNGDPTGVFIEREFQPIAELVWFRDATRFSHADRVRALPQSARLYPGFGTTRVYEGHGIAAQGVHASREVHRAGALTMRATLAISPSWTKAAVAPGLESWVKAHFRDWSGGLAEPGAGDEWLKVSGLFAAIGRSRADDVRGAA